MAGAIAGSVTSSEDEHATTLAANSPTTSPDASLVPVVFSAVMPSTVCALRLSGIALRRFTGVALVTELGLWSEILRRLTNYGVQRSTNCNRRWVEDVSTENLSKNPTPDEAEDNAFFPSPYSLSQYTAPKTDFDGIATERGAYSGGRWKVLVIASEERYLLMQNEAMFSTGNHPVETLLPLHHILEAGFDVDVATLTGAPAKFEWWAFPSEDDAVSAAWDKLRDKFKSPKNLRAVVADELGKDSDYLGVFIPGGHGAMFGLADSLDVRSTLDWALAEDKLIISLCHGPAAFLAASIGRDSSPFAGYSMCAFPDAIDAGANVDIGYLPGPMPWFLGEALQRDGITLANDEMTGATIRDRNVLSGDSPLAAHSLGKMTAEALVEKAG